MVGILNDISNQLRNTSNSVIDSTVAAYAISSAISSVAIVLLTVSLSIALWASAQALYLKHWLSSHAGYWETFHNPEEEAIKREVYAQGLKRWAIPSLFELLPLLMQLAVFCFFVGAFFAVILSNIWASIAIVLGLYAAFLLGRHVYQVLTRDPYTPFSYSRPLIFNVVRTWSERSRSSLHEDALNPEIARAAILNRLFMHASMTPNNLSTFIQLFSLPVKHPQLRVKSLAPWCQLSSLLPSVLMKTHSHSRYYPLPVLRLSLLVLVQGPSKQLPINNEVKRADSTTNTSDPLQNLYLHLLLSQLHATAGGTDHWQEACRILRCLEYSEEHTSELVWLVDSIQLYTLQIKADFIARIVEFLRGVVVYLAKCPGDEDNADLLRTASIMAAEWLISRQISDNETLPRQWILSSQGVHSGEDEGKGEGEGEGNQKMFVLVENLRLSQSESLQRTINLYQDSQKTDSRSNFDIRTLLIPIMAVEGFAVEKNGENLVDAVPRIQIGDLRCSLEGLWDLWEGGFNQSDLLRFVLTLVVPPSSPVGDMQSSMVVLLLKGYLQQINESPALITENAFRFIDAAFEHSLTTGTSRDELEPQLQDVQFPNPWLALHIDTILRRRSTPSAANLEAVTTLDSRVKAIVSKKRLNLYLSSNVDPEPDVLTLLLQSDDRVISLEAFGQSVDLLESPSTGESGGRSPRPPTLALLEQEKRLHLISRFFDPQQSTSMCQSVWIMLTEDLYPGWERIPTDWRRDIATALVEATEWMVKGQAILAEAIKKPRRIRASGKAKQVIGATALALLNRSDTEPHKKRNVLLETRDEHFKERLEACAQVYLRLFAVAVEELGEGAKSHTQHIVAFLVDIPDVLFNEGAIQRIQHVLGL